MKSKTKVPKIKEKLLNFDLEIKETQDIIAELTGVRIGRGRRKKVESEYEREVRDYAKNIKIQQKLTVRLINLRKKANNKLHAKAQQNAEKATAPITLLNSPAQIKASLSMVKMTNNESIKLKYILFEKEKLTLIPFQNTPIKITEEVLTWLESGYTNYYDSEAEQTEDWWDSEEGIESKFNRVMGKILHRWEGFEKWSKVINKENPSILEQIAIHKKALMKEAELESEESGEDIFSSILNVLETEFLF